MKAGVKTTTLRYTKNNGFNVIASFPNKKYQISRLPNKDYEFFIATGNKDIPQTIGHEKEGSVVIADAKKLHEWLTYKRAEVCRPGLDFLVEDRVQGISWYNIPECKHTTDWCYEIGRLNESDIKLLRGMGNTHWTYKDGYATKIDNEYDTTDMVKKGTIGETIIQRYLEQNLFDFPHKVKEVIIDNETYADIDLEIILDND